MLALVAGPSAHGQAISLPGCRPGEAGSNRFFKEKLAKKFHNDCSFATLNHGIIRTRAADDVADDDARDHDVASFSTDTHTWAARDLPERISELHPSQPTATS